MIRVTFEMVPGGQEDRKRTIGMIEIANVGIPGLIGSYNVVAKKTPPFEGALHKAWKRAELTAGYEDEAIMSGHVVGFHREKRGVYDLLYRALVALGMDKRSASGI